MASSSGRRVRGDAWRGNWSLLAAAVGGALAYGALGALGTVAGRTERLIVAFAVLWIVFAVVYIAWTHRTYSSRTRAALAEAARRDAGRRGVLRTVLTGTGGPTDWTVGGASAAVLITVVIAMSPEVRVSPPLIVLGLAAVACSWALMVYSFALTYLRMALTQPAADAAERPHFAFDLDDDPAFSDFLTHAALLSSMAAAVPGTARTRAAWRVARANVLLAFVFNTVIVAMMVSLLFGGLAG